MRLRLLTLCPMWPVPQVAAYQSPRSLAIEGNQLGGSPSSANPIFGYLVADILFGAEGNTSMTEMRNQL